MDAGKYTKSYILAEEYNDPLGRDYPVRYVASTLGEKLSEIVRARPNILKFFFSDQIDDWDTATSHFRRCSTAC